MEFTSKARLENGCIIAEVIAPAAGENTKYAYYLYEKTQGLLEKRMYTSNPTCSFQPPCSGTYYVKAFVRHWPNGDKGDFTTISQKTNNVSVYPTKPLSYEDLDAERFQKSGSTLYTILWDGVRFEFLINYRPGSSRAVVFGTGKVSGDIRPVFSRATWANDLPETAIYYFDPTVYLGDCNLGWCYGTNDRWYLKDISHLLEVILRKLDIPVSNTLFYGSSGGGFTSMCLASMLQSKATVINPQFLVENYKAPALKRLKSVCLRNGETLLSERLSVLSVFEKYSYFPPLHIVENILSPDDIETQLTPFLQQLTQAAPNSIRRLTVDFFSHEDGHNGMLSKDVCLRHIAEDLDQLSPVHPGVEL